MPADLGNPSAYGHVLGSGGTECWKCVPSRRRTKNYWREPAKNFLPEYVGRVEGGVGVVVTRLAEAEACWSAVRGTRKEDGLGSLEGAVVRGV